VLEVILYRSAGNALRDNALHAIRITLAVLVVFVATQLGFLGVLTGMSLIELAGVIFMFHALTIAFPEFSLRMLWKDVARIAVATSAIVGVGVLFGWKTLPLHLPERLAIVIRLGQVALGCLMAAWPALTLTGAVSLSEWRTILAAILPWRQQPVVAAPSLQDVRL
jgi:hypothetical protein